MNRFAERITIWVAWKLPRRLVAWCVARVLAHATTGERSNVVVPEVTVMDALKAWERA